jgi:hypothetical protein
MHIVAAVDATERSLDSLALAKLLGDATGAPVHVVSVFPYVPLTDHMTMQSTLGTRYGSAVKTVA